MTDSGRLFFNFFLQFVQLFELTSELIILLRFFNIFNFFNFLKFLNKILENVDSEIHGKILLLKKSLKNTAEIGAATPATAPLLP